VDICIKGEINTDGAGLIDPRIGSARSCGERQVCCRHPDTPKPVDYCPDNTACTEYEYCSYEGHVVEILHYGQVHEGQSCYLNPGSDTATGVCCGPAVDPVPRVPEVCQADEECVESCPAADAGADGYGPGAPPPKSCTLGAGYSGAVGTCCKKEVPPKDPVPYPCVPEERCMAKGYCDASGYSSTLEILDTSLHYQGQDCYLEGVEGVVGTCCKPPKIEECPPGGICTPHNYCGADGHLTPTAHTGPTYADGQACPIGVESGAVGVCCGPTKTTPDCSAGNECTPPEYCDTDGYVVSKPTSNPYTTGQECSLLGGYGGYGVCCNPATPPQYCPKDSECVPKEFCFGSVLEANSEDAWSGYATQKNWHTCALPGAPEGGVCCKTSPVERQCGKSYYASQQVDTRFYEPELDKLEADFGEFPWQAIVFYSNYTFKCGASLISDRHLLTVAHCVNGIYPSDLKIRLGDWQVNSFTEPLPYQDVDVSKVYIHPEFQKKNVWNNIAILELKQKVNYEYNINNVCLPGPGYSPFQPGTYCVVAGWGKDSFAGTYQHILKKIEVPLVEQKQCQVLFRKTRLGPYFRLHNSYLCAGGEQGKDACVGDGGGPLICFNEETQAYTQVGITAWGIGCGTKDVPGAYTNVAEFLPWIDSIINNQGTTPVY